MKHLLPFFLLLYACHLKTERQPGFAFKRPKVVEAVSYKLNPDSLAPPVVVRALPPAKITLEKPQVVQLPSNEFTSRVTDIVPSSSPEMVVTHRVANEPPRVVAALTNRHAALPAEVITVSGLRFSDNSRSMFSTIKAKDGLHSDEISSLLQDKNGNLWIGQWWGGGITKYDGRSLWNYTIKQGLSSDVVNCLYEDTQGNIWAGTYDSGVNMFNGNFFAHYSLKEGLQDNIVYCIAQDKSGNMWFGTNNGLSKFDGRNFTHYTTSQGLPTNVVRSLMVDSKGQLWAGANGGLMRFDGQYFQNYSTALHFDDDTELTAIMEDTKGNIWVGTNIGLFEFEGDSIKRFTSEGGLSSNNINSIMQAYNGDIWIASRGGVNRYNGRSFIHYGSEQGLPNNRVTSCIQDKWGNIWLGTTGGVCKFEGNLFTHVTPVKQEEIETLLTDRKGNVWMGSGSDSCVNKYDGKSMIRYSQKEMTSMNYLYQDRRSNIWFATWYGVYKYDGKVLNHYSKVNGLIDSVVFTMLEDRHGNMWFATNKGLSKFDGTYFTNYSKAQGLNSETIFPLLEDHNGNIWIGTNDKGICRFDGKTFTHFPPNNLSHPMVVGLIEDHNNNIWICTAYGVNKFDGKYFTWYTSEQGLSNNITKDVLEDRNGNIWVGTIKGLNRYTPMAESTDASRNDVPSYFKNYTVTDGFTGGGTYENAMYMDKDGKIWIGSNDRLTLYHPEGDIPDTIAPVLQLTGISMFNENINWQDVKRKKDKSYTLHNGRQLSGIQFTGLTRWFSLPENLQLPYDNNAITFQFIGITTNRPKEVRYRYLLEGLDNEWTSTIEPLASYNNLPHGKFKLRVQSVNTEGRWSNELNYSFIILPPWWQTTFAYVIYVITFAALSWLFTSYRSRRLKAENIRLEKNVAARTKELEQSLEERFRLSEQIKSQQALLNERLRISRDLHDEIGTTLGSISIYSEVAKKRSEKNENPGTVLSKIGSASRELIDKMSDIVWSLNLNHENFEQMEHRMRVFATMMLSPRNIRYQFDIDEHSKTSQLSNAQAKNIFLIYKEALHNIVKYADCSSVHIQFDADGGKLNMTIRDNGKGFPVSEAMRTGDSLGGNGIKNMYVRCNDIQANLTFDSRMDAGTTIRLSMPL